MTFRPNTSFPYLAIAKRFDVPYAQVLAVLERLENPIRQSAWIDSPGQMPADVVDFIYLAWRAEKTRRFMVNEGPL